MLQLYSRWIGGWEYELATRDKNRVVRPFEWGADWLGVVSSNGDPSAAIREHVRRSVADSDAYFSCPTPEDYRLSGSHLTFSSPLGTPYPENNLVHGEFFPVPDRRRRAVLVLPQWNADAQGHIGLCRLLNKFGLTALRMSMPYHDRRMPPELQRADYHVSSNIGRTIHACRQAVVDSRACLDWLQSQGYERLGILGTSLGSCIAFITAAHDTRVRAGAFNHVSMNFGDVVWTGISTGHVRKALEEQVTQDQLREHWGVISPASYIDRFEGRSLRSLLIWARHDTTFLPCFSKQVLEGFRRRKIPHQAVCLPCGHYTTGQFPFNLVDGLTMSWFLRRNL
jgi:hypothetical protein